MHSYYDLTKFKFSRSSGYVIMKEMIIIHMDNDKGDQLGKKIWEFAFNTRPRDVNMEKEKENVMNSASQKNKNGL